MQAWCKKIITLGGEDCRKECAKLAVRDAEIIKLLEKSLNSEHIYARGCVHEAIKKLKEEAI